MAEGGDSVSRDICRQCDKAVATGSNFCGFCGIRNPGAPHRSVGAPLALASTLAWLVVTALFLNEPTKGEASRSLFFYSLAFLSPLLIVLAAAAVLLRKQGNITLGPGIAALVVGAWFIASLMIFSQPRPTDVTPLDWIGFTLALLGAWFVLLIPAALRIWKAIGRTGLLKMASYVLPLPLAVTSCVTLVSTEVPEETRLRLSEPALNRHVAEFQSNGSAPDDRLVGLLRVEKTYRSGECILLRLDSRGDVFGGPTNEDGLAYCPAGNPPDIVAWYFRHEHGGWWTYETHFS
jgi:hypothetical protein